VKISNKFFSFFSSLNQYFPHIPYVASKNILWQKQIVRRPKIKMGTDERFFFYMQNFEYRGLAQSKKNQYLFFILFILLQEFKMTAQIGLTIFSELPMRPMTIYNIFFHKSNTRVEKRITNYHENIMHNIFIII
jgi:hypothetical protein